MCDYSLENQTRRPAQTGDKLVTTSFPRTWTRGFCEEGNPQMAVCLMPGTELAFDKPVVVAGLRGFIDSLLGKVSRTARFRQINMELRNANHDAVELDDGRIMLLTNLREGQRATVLQLPASARPTDVTQPQDFETAS